ncbi:unnamed protein product [Bemisia tabaci]|uniref:Uncharacterized protein n=1 Tax=Bemisia tabaci TaxID=7038 RepID=A0A9P0ABX9_BEMTA|nr:unnamed protein product [Bemisia tabaci]
MNGGGGIHKPGERGVRLHAHPGAGRRRGCPLVRRAPSGGAHLPLPLLLVHGQRDLLPSEALPRGGVQGELLEPLLVHHRLPLREHAPHQLRAGLLHRGLHRAQGLRHVPSPPGHRPGLTGPDPQARGPAPWAPEAPPPGGPAPRSPRPRQDQPRQGFRPVHYRPLAPPKAPLSLLLRP